MFVDYDYYKNDFKGTLLTENEFNKYGNNACSKITASTMSRVTDSMINTYPLELVKSIKYCACAIAEWLKRFSDALDSLTGTASGSTSEGIIRSKTAGAVSVTYDTTTSFSYLLDPKKQDDIINSVINSYLSARCTVGIFYNLLSKKLGKTNTCKSCCII